MRTYRAQVPLVITSSERNDRLGFRTSWGARIDGEFAWQGLSCRVKSQDDGSILAMFDNVGAASQREAYAQVCDALDVVAPIISLEVQREHANRHYGPLRVTWSRAAVAITPSDQWPATSLALRVETRITLTRVNDDLAVIAARPELRPLLLSYDRALAPDDDETRFFNAFAIVEFIEGRFARRERFTALLEEPAIDAVIAAAQACLRERALPVSVTQRVGNLLGGPLRRGTLEGREVKLLTVLRDDFGITRVEDALGQVEVDLALVREFTDARNHLFHGTGGAGARLARLTDHLTLVVERILRAFLEGRVVVPVPLM